MLTHTIEKTHFPFRLSIISYNFELGKKA